MKSLLSCLFFYFLFLLNLTAQTEIHTLIHQQTVDKEVLFDQDNYAIDKPGNGIRKAAIGDFGNPPGWIWLKQFGGSGADVGKAITSDDMGNMYVAANFAGNLVIGEDTLKGTGTGDLLIMKLSQIGFPLWYKQIPAPPAGRNYCGIYSPG